MSYPKGETDAELLETFKGWFKQVMTVEAEQRVREVEDLRFQVDAWDEVARKERTGRDGAPGRPILNVSLVKQPMQLVKNQAEAADLGIEIHPVSEKAEKEVAETMQDHYREIERDSGAEQVRLWAFDRGLQAGRGYWRVDMVYDEDSDSPYDQKIQINRILDGSRVGFDPSAQKADLSDANWAFAWGWVPYETYRTENPDDPLSDLDDKGFAELAADEPDWIQGEGEKRAVMVAEIWRRKREKQRVVLVKEGREFITVPEDQAGKKKRYAERAVEQVTLCWYKATARGIRDREEWAPEYDGSGKVTRPGLSQIPLVPFHAIEQQPFDGQRRIEGMVRGARDAQRVYDYALSAAVEDVGRLSKIPYIGAAGAFAGHEAKWNTANTRNWSYIEYNTVGNDGQQIPPPQPMQVDGTKLGLSLQLAEMARGASQVATAIFDPSLGKAEGRHESGRKVLALQQQADAGTSNFLQTMANISMRCEARIVLERMVYGYDRPGRIVTTRGPEDEVKQVMLNAHYKTGADGRPKRVNPNEQGAKFLNYRQGGKYGVAVTVGKAYQTRMQQGREQLGELLPNLPPELQVLLLPTYMRFMETPGSKEAADLMTKFRDSKFPGLANDKDQQPTPDQLQAQLAGMKQAMEQGQQQLQMAMQQIQTDHAKQQAAMFKAQLDAQTTMQKTQMDNAAKIEVARISAAKESANQAAEAQEELLATGIKVAHETQQKALDRQHEKEMQAHGSAHDVGMAAAGAQTMTRKQEGGQEQGQEQTQEQGGGSTQSRDQSNEPSPQAGGSGQ